MFALTARATDYITSSTEKTWLIRCALRAGQLQLRFPAPNDDVYSEVGRKINSGRTDWLTVGLTPIIYVAVWVIRYPDLQGWYWRKNAEMPPRSKMPIESAIQLQARAVHWSSQLDIGTQFFVSLVQTSAPLTRDRWRQTLMSTGQHSATVP